MRSGLVSSRQIMTSKTQMWRTSHLTVDDTPDLEQQCPEGCSKTDPDSCVVHWLWLPAPHRWHLSFVDHLSDTTDSHHLFTWLWFVWSHFQRSSPHPWCPSIGSLDDCLFWLLNRLTKILRIKFFEKIFQLLFEKFSNIKIRDKNIIDF